MFSSVAFSGPSRGSGGNGAGEPGVSVTGVPYREVLRDKEWYGVSEGEGNGWLEMKVSWSEKYSVAILCGAVESLCMPRYHMMLVVFQNYIQTVLMLCGI